jgi:hypothetical protein
MTTELAQARARRATWIVGLAAVLAITASVTVAIQSRSRDAEAVTGQVLPEFAARSRDAAKITIASSTARYEIQRTQKGWALKDRGNYPVRREVLGQFTEGLRSLAFVRPMTRDPERHERLGLGDPLKGGSGVLVQVEDSQGARLADLIIGEAPGGQLFLRRPGDDQTWQVRGTLPRLKDASAWLDLAPIQMDAARIASAQVEPSAGPVYAVQRATDAQAFALAAPHDKLVVLAPGLVAEAALKIAQLEPVDVRPAAAVAGPPKARTHVRTFDGLLLEGELFEDGGKFWIKIVARAEKPEKEAEAIEINARVAPWAYGLNEAQYQDAAPLLSTLAAQPEPEPAPEPKAKKKR